MSWVAAGVASASLTKSIISGVSAGNRRKKAEKELEGLANSYKPNSSILDFYNRSLAKYNANPYESQSFQQQQNLINRNLATGISASQDRRGGLATISGLVQGANDASARAGATAEQQQSQNLGMLGRAAQAKTAEEKYPFEMKYNLLAMKAGQSATAQNMADKNIGNQLNNIGMLMYDKYGSKGSGNNTGGESPRTF